MMIQKISLNWNKALIILCINWILFFSCRETKNNNTTIGEPTKSIIFLDFFDSTQITIFNTKKIFEQKKIRSNTLNGDFYQYRFKGLKSISVKIENDTSFHFTSDVLENKYFIIKKEYGEKLYTLKMAKDTTIGVW